jgi:hypothetical protein
MTTGSLRVPICLSVVAVICCGVVASSLVREPPIGEPEVYRGGCDASAAVALDNDRFVVADDEDKANSLRVYKFGQPEPVSIIPMNSFLNVEGEVDIEGAERVGDLIYWIGSHSRTSSDKRRVDRDRLFTTRLSYKDGTATLTPSGKPYTRLLEDIAANPNLKNLQLGPATERAPESAAGLNIEALGHFGSSLLIGFRGPTSNGKAIVLTLRNPQAVVSDPRVRASIGAFTLLSLGGRGVRGMATFPRSSDILVIAGPEDDRRDFAVYRWAGPGHDASPLPAMDFGTPCIRRAWSYAVLVLSTS